MKRLTTSLTFALATLVHLPVWAMPTTFGYSGQLREDGQLKNGTVEVVVELFSSASGGAALYTENHSSVAVTDGVFDLEVGSITALDDTVLAAEDLYLEIAVEDTTLSPRTAVHAVPFALRAHDAESLGGLSADDVALKTDVTTAKTQVDGLTTRMVGVETKASATEAKVAGLGNAGGQAVAFANVTGLAFGQGLLLQNGAVSIADVGIGSAKLTNNAVTTAKIADGAVGATDIANGTIRSNHLGSGARKLWIRPKGCTNGGALEVTAGDATLTCASKSCGFGAGASFERCNGTCTSYNAVTCTGDLAGFLVAQ